MIHIFRHRGSKSLVGRTVRSFHPLLYHIYTFRTSVLPLYNTIGFRARNSLDEHTFLVSYPLKYTLYDKIHKHFLLLCRWYILCTTISLPRFGIFPLRRMDTNHCCKNCQTDLPDTFCSFLASASPNSDLLSVSPLDIFYIL